MAALWVPFDDIYCGASASELSLCDGLSRVGFRSDPAESVATPVERRSFDRWTKNNNNYYYIKKIIIKKNYKLKKKITNSGQFGTNCP
jgi:hypothetical protein